MPLAYYARSATAEFWSEHWGGQSLATLLEVARRSPLTDLIEAHLPPRGVVLEAGCGLGQYVLLLRERGRAAVGVDWSVDALRQAARVGGPLAAMDLRGLAVKPGAVHAYLSLGVVEHDPEGPAAIVAEAARVLAPGGTLLLSVPYWNGARRLGTPLIARASRRVREAGGQFYQFAFTSKEVRAFLEREGFEVRDFHPYDPARLLRSALRRLRGSGGRAPRDAAIAPGGAPERHPSAMRGLARAVLYSGPALRLFGHMILAVAVKRVAP